jgi:hypothetical protein
MAFTYDHASSPTLAKIRLLIGDSRQADGPRPDGSNFSDEELGVFLDMEGSHAMRAAAAGVEALAAEWSAYTGMLRTGPVDEQYQQAAAYAERAAVMRAAWGYGADQSQMQAGYSVRTKRK